MSFRLLLHREASSVIADTFEMYANAYERALLLHNLYGKEVALFYSLRWIRAQPLTLFLLYRWTSKSGRQPGILVYYT